jgi:hypothetical protein
MSYLDFKKYKIVVTDDKTAPYKIYGTKWKELTLRRCLYSPKLYAINYKKRGLIEETGIDENRVLTAIAATT